MYIFILVILGLTFGARIITVLVPMGLLKLFAPHKFNIKFNELVLIMIGGMIRGPIAFGLSLQVTTPSKFLIKITT